MQFFVGVITHTPLWVWAIPAFLMYRGWIMSRDRATRPWALLLMPGIFILLAAAKLALLNTDAKALLVMFFGIAFGFLAVLLIKPARSTRALEDGRLQVKGEWLSLCIFMSVFVVNYSAAVLTAIHSPAADFVSPVSTLLNGFSVGFTTFRAFSHLKFKRRDAALSLSNVNF